MSYARAQVNYTPCKATGNAQSTAGKVRRDCRVFFIIQAAVRRKTAAPPPDDGDDGSGWIRTTVGIAGRFTVCSLCPLGHTPDVLADYSIGLPVTGQATTGQRAPRLRNKGGSPMDRRVGGRCLALKAPNPSVSHITHVSRRCRLLSVGASGGGYSTRTLTGPSATLLIVMRWPNAPPATWPPYFFKDSTSFS